ncbi:MULTISPECIES: arginine-ornithine antiporter [unclassified Rhizobium]|uniref:arginine-ornithine antiporter n=1 Tax=unclassified Rhizobium TaxID=2613769 RepID=UPI001ADD4363|nr:MULTISPECIES: arginine-ornithine antiporter [unclassified Rhizobium]MBO9099619.1 arginine-ornithine antiporter [Rhizobium sp. L58/93]QXZ86910.1 arginine-ornithine antiporter [Rhizobium sp. K1/93]QXZ93056.1 arginine-ornithine antiporter [Rhizobium sp. K15/93]
MVAINIDVTSVPQAKLAGKLGLVPLVALVVGSMIGGGVFSLPQNMAKGASPGAVLIGWLITGIGMLALAFVYQSLSTRKPMLDAGPYAYARAGFGDFVGFNSAWGYWLSAWLGNVSYVVLIFGALSYFYPAFGAEGNTTQAIIGASLALWATHFLVLMGIRQAAIINVVTTVAKLVPILLFILLVAMAFNLPKISFDFWGAQTPDLGSVMAQVKSTMLVTLWVFIGIEGASVVSGRAARRQDIGRATIIGFVIALTAYLFVSLLSFGVLNQPELAALPAAASMANVLEQTVGPWGSVLVRLGLVISVAGAFLSWTLFAAEIPYRAAKEGILPDIFARENKNGAPAGALWITNILVQMFLIVTLYANSTYMALFYIASAAILVPYVLSGAYALKLALTGEGYAEGERRGRDMFTGALATAYGMWLIYAAGPSYLLMCAILYAVGVPVYWLARSGRGQKAFSPVEALIGVGIVIAAIIAGYLMWTGAISAL